MKVFAVLALAPVFVWAASEADTLPGNFKKGDTVWFCGQEDEDNDNVLHCGHLIGGDAYIRRGDKGKVMSRAWVREREGPTLNSKSDSSEENDPCTFRVFVEFETCRAVGAEGLAETDPERRKYWLPVRACEPEISDSMSYTPEEEDEESDYEEDCGPQITKDAKEVAKVLAERAATDAAEQARRDEQAAIPFKVGSKALIRLGHKEKLSKDPKDFVNKSYGCTITKVIGNQRRIQLDTKRLKCFPWCPCSNEVKNYCGFILAGWKEQLGEGNYVMDVQQGTSASVAPSIHLQVDMDLLKQSRRRLIASPDCDTATHRRELKQVRGH